MSNKAGPALLLVAVILGGCKPSPATPARAAAAAARSGDSTTSAPGPSFDCTKAQGDLGTTTCGDADLAAADRRMADAFSRLLAAVPPTWKGPLRDSQRSFLTYAVIKCRESAPHGKLDADCLTPLYDSRTTLLNQSSLKRTGQGQGVIMLATYTAWAYRRDRKDPDDIDPTGSCVTTVPQLMAPANDQERRWNILVGQRIKAFGKPFCETGASGETAIGGALVGTGPGSLETSIEWDFRNMSRSEQLHWSTAKGRELRANDILSDPATALPRLDRLMIAAVRKDPGAYEMSNEAVSFLEDIRDAKAWTLSPEAFTLTSADPPVYRVADLKWSEVRPMLRRDLPFDPSALKAPQDLTTP